MEALAVILLLAVAYCWLEWGGRTDG